MTTDPSLSTDRWPIESGSALAASIITVTPNPAVDKTAYLDALLVGALNRLGRPTVDAGGKGINVSRTLEALGVASQASGFVGGGSGQQLLACLDGANFTLEFVPVGGATRTNLKVICANDGLTELNEAGPTVSTDEFNSLVDRLLDWAAPGVVLVFAGSLPPGIDPVTYVALIAACRDKGAIVIVDADGPTLRLATSVPGVIIKPNCFELGQLVGRETEPSLDESCALALDLIAQGVGLVLVSAGADGALFVDRRQVIRAPAVPVKVASTVGAGDAMVAALALAISRDWPLDEAARLAMACAAGACTTLGTTPPPKELVDQLLTEVQLEVLDAL
ncbi:MAG: 1-phosphofructokinase family hexose kinase [Propionibacteriaceae bacterium]|jgi:1-phosphofructokinase|nr:1-phosphofructokinase family hexose kinase [Propionibacteriaceae bacterium]